MTDQDAANLSSLTAMPGYQILLRIIEDICRASESHLVWIDPEKEGTGAVVSAQATARAQRLFANALSNKVAFEIKEWKDQLEAKRLGLD